MCVCLLFVHLDTIRPNAMKFGREYPFIQRKVETRLAEPKVGFWVGFSKFSGKPYENFFDFSKNLKIFPTVRLLSSRFYLFALSLGREVPFDPKLSLPRYIDIYIYEEECLSVCLSVRYAFGPCNSYRHQTFHDTSLGPEEGRHGVGITKKGQEGVSG